MGLQQKSVISKDESQWQFTCTLSWKSRQVVAISAERILWNRKCLLLTDQIKKVTKTSSSDIESLLWSQTSTKGFFFFMFTVIVRHKICLLRFSNTTNGEILYYWSFFHWILLTQFEDCKRWRGGTCPFLVYKVWHEFIHYNMSNLAFHKVQKFFSERSWLML